MKKKPQKTPKKFHCKKCDFFSRNKKDFNRHLSTTKHKMDNMDNTLDNTKNPTPLYVCVCGKKYKFCSGLSKHKKKCLHVSRDNIHKKTPDEETICSDYSKTRENDIVTAQMFNKVLQQNNVLMEKLVELSKEKKVINYQNCNNKKMTINVFLNEQCKDAMNLTEFVENVRVSLQDLHYTKENGYIDGISNIFVKHLQDMKPTERPIHCSDKKRMQFYVKDSNVWEKDKSHEKIDKSIQDITIKQIKQIKQWEKQNPGYLQNEKLMSEWHSMVKQMMGGGEATECTRNFEQIKKSLSSTTEIKGVLLNDVEEKNE
jgi:hypothetical protein